MLIIGERINASSKRVAEAIGARDAAYLQNLALRQVDAGAYYIDVNAGTGQELNREKEDLKWVMHSIREVTEAPLSIDSSSAAVIAQALEHYQGEKALINSVNGEESRLEEILPLAAQRPLGVIALLMDDSGVPKDIDGRLRVADSILNRATASGIPVERMYLDPLALPLSVDSGQGLVTLRTLEQIKARYPQARTTMGLSNVSFGLPMRRVVNWTLLLMAMHLGLDSAILDPLDDRLMTSIRAAELVLGRDPFCRRYITDYRKGRIKA